jgi:hypothetical protein
MCVFRLSTVISSSPPSTDYNGCTQLRSFTVPFEAQCACFDAVRLPTAVDTKLRGLIYHSLNFNHFWMKGLAGYLLHPKIPTDQAELRVADLGAGTG